MAIYTTNNKIWKLDNKWVNKPDVVPPAPPIPSNTVRVRTSDGEVPIKKSAAGHTTSYETATLVSGTTDVYDVYKSGNDFSNLLYNSRNVIEVLGANTTGITNMYYMFYNCSSLTTIPLFDTSSVTNMGYMFNYCTSLTTIPLFDTSSATITGLMFDSCYNVQSGALALYQQMSSQTNPPGSHDRTFDRCGSNTQTGSAELAQIPSDWGGTGA